MAISQSAPELCVPDELSIPVDFSAMYEAHFGYVWHTLRRLGVRPSDVDDAAHDVFVVVYRRFSDFDATRPVKPWLFGIALRVASERRRRGWRGWQLEDNRRTVTGEIEGPSFDIPDGSPGPDELLSQRETKDRVAAALSQLDLPQRAVLIMHDIDGHSAPEIASTLDVPLNTVYSRLRLARQKFAAAVRADGSEGNTP